MKCEFCGKENCMCLKSKGLIGIIFLLLAYALWVGSWPLNQVIAVVLVIVAIKKIAISLMAFKK